MSISGIKIWKGWSKGLDILNDSANTANSHNVPYKEVSKGMIQQQTKNVEFSAKGKQK